MRTPAGARPITTRKAGTKEARVPLSPALVAELRGRDPEYRPNPVYDPFAEEEAPPEPDLPETPEHGSARGLQRHARLEEPFCDACAALVQDLVAAGLAQALCRGCGRPMVAQPVYERDPTLRKRGLVRVNAFGLCVRCYNRARNAGTLPEPAPSDRRSARPHITVKSVHIVTCNRCGEVGTASTYKDAMRLRAEHGATHERNPQ
ncbi:hypothetical protein BAY59_10925 [Prauserella coralliicola]|nr:hypothetical protein BAY59_10925 [Prauserella coralliicola]